MSSPENPFAGSEPPSVNPPAAVPAEVRGGVPPNTADAGLTERFPLWGLKEVLFVLLFAATSILVCSVLAFIVVFAMPQLHGMKPEQVSTDPRVVLPAQLVAYALTLAFIYRMLAHHYHAPFLESIRWRWPAKWPLYLVSGSVLALAIQAVMSRLPVPQSMPIDQFFQNPVGAWFMMIFGVLIAPFAEELFFRGLLFPVLARALGMVAGLVLTAIGFAMVHASQLGKAWAPILMMFIVGLVLTLVRARARSLAASVLMHVGYNGALFTALYIGTKGFHDFKVLAR